nr:integrase, catalytic region, zinc finger, CCHC-type, peptidase aspartic, catalytic [Tanacetum cinerariifolium]
MSNTLHNAIMEAGSKDRPPMLAPGLKTELSKSKMISKSFESVQKHAINLKLELQQCKEKIKNDMLFKVNKTKDFCKEREQYFEIQDLKAQLQDKGIVIRVIPTTSVSRPPLKSNPQGDRLIEIVLFIVDSGCSKYMIGNLKLLINFVENFLGTVKFMNDQIAPILGYGDLVQGAVTIKRVYNVEGLNHNLFSIGQFYDADLEVAFRKSTCFIRDLKGNDLLTGSHGIDLYSIKLQDINCPNPICLMAKATSFQAWLWHRRLSYLNFDTINLLSKNDIVVGLPKLKFVKDHLSFSLSTLVPTVSSSENINQAETYAENDQVADDEFINIFSTPVQDQGETSSRHVDSSNIHTFYQRYPSEHCWTKDHPLEQVIKNPSQSIRTRRQLESNAEMCMFALTVSRIEPKNIKEAMADSAWIESMLEELYQFNRLDVWELVDRPLCTNVINLKWL